MRTNSEKEGEMFFYGVLLGITLGIFFFGILNAVQDRIEKEENTQHIINDFTNFTDTLKEFQKTPRCSGTFFVEKPEGWTIFTSNDCIEGGYCKTAYIPIEECFNGK